MRCSPVRPLAAACAAVIASGALAACEVNLNTEGLSARETRSFKVTGRPDVVLDTFDGSVEVHSWDRDEVEVEIEKRAMEQDLIDQITIDVEQEGNRVVVRVKGPADRERGALTIGMHISPSARLRVAIPRAANLDVRSGDGSISVEEVGGRIVLATEDGRVTAARLSGDIHVRTFDGSIRFERVSGRLDVETNDGSIGIQGAPSALHVKTGDGSIRVRVDADAAMVADWDVTTGDGTVVLTLPASFDAEVDAETSDGVVRSSHPSLRDDTGDRRRAVDRDDRRERRRTLRATMGAGGKTIRVRTGDGSIRFES